MNLPRLYRQHVIRTALTAEQALERLDSVLEPKRSLWSRYGDALTKPKYLDKKHYQGEIDGDKFEFRETFAGRNSYFPIVRGQV